MNIYLYILAMALTTYLILRPAHDDLPQAH